MDIITSPLNSHQIMPNMEKSVYSGYPWDQYFDPYRQVAVTTGHSYRVEAMDC